MRCRHIPQGPALKREPLWRPLGPGWAMGRQAAPDRTSSRTPICRGPWGVGVGGLGFPDMGVGGGIGVTQRVEQTWKRGDADLALGMQMSAWPGTTGSGAGGHQSLSGTRVQGP